jgi:hypothetical protein
LHFISQERNER